MTNETDKTAGTVYEVGFHIVPTVSPENLPKEVDAIKAVLAKNGAVTISEEFPKLRALAYQMVKVVGPARHRHDSAYFGWIKFEAPKTAVAEINKAMDANEKVLRYIVIKTVAENTLYGDKLAADAKAVKDEEAAKVADSKAAAVEIDKSIDKLVA
jgi:ribosomal protein S6